MSKPARNLIGERFGRLQVLEVAPRQQKGRTRWLCKCDCGQTKKIEGYCLTRGTTRSCGCLKRERASSLYKTNMRWISHG